jgi:hypothetical protein
MVWLVYALLCSFMTTVFMYPVLAWLDVVYGKTSPALWPPLVGAAMGVVFCWAFPETVRRAGDSPKVFGYCLLASLSVAACAFVGMLVGGAAASVNIDETAKWGYYAGGVTPAVVFLVVSTARRLGRRP